MKRVNFSRADLTHIYWERREGSIPQPTLRQWPFLSWTLRPPQSSPAGVRRTCSPLFFPTRSTQLLTCTPPQQRSRTGSFSMPRKEAPKWRALKFQEWRAFWSPWSASFQRWPSDAVTFWNTCSGFIVKLWARTACSSSTCVPWGSSCVGCQKKTSGLVKKYFLKENLCFNLKTIYWQLKGKTAFIFWNKYVSIIFFMF